MEQSGEESRRLPGEMMGTLGKAASYSPNLPLDGDDSADSVFMPPAMPSFHDESSETSLQMKERPVLQSYQKGTISAGSGGGRLGGGRSPGDIEDAPRPAPRPNLSHANHRSQSASKRAFWTKPKVIAAGVGVGLVLLLVVVLPIALTLSHNARLASAADNSTSNGTFHGDALGLLGLDGKDKDSETVEMVFDDELETGGTGKGKIGTEEGTEDDSPDFADPDENLDTLLDLYFNMDGSRRASSSLPRLRPPVANCSAQGHRCEEDGSFVGRHLLCDGAPDCPKGSDELGCSACQTALSCPRGEEGAADSLLCLRADRLCDGVRDCADGEDEERHCRLESCKEGEFRCQSTGKLAVCIPQDWRCDGDAHCPREDDEAGCAAVVAAEGGCRRGASWCAADERCFPAWQKCDGAKHCSSGLDELGCDCASCQGADRVLCSKEKGSASGGVCVARERLCDGRDDCPGGQDEQHCPGWCAPESVGASKLCSDGERYPLRMACSGNLPQCDDACRSCDPEIAFTCPAKKEDPSGPGPLCISRSQMCDGSSDCADGSDEAAAECSCEADAADPDRTPFRCPPAAGKVALGRGGNGHVKCIRAERRCDGFPDCGDGADEADCDDCASPAATPDGQMSSFYCAADRSCHPSTVRCDGAVHCDDYSDEDDCGCTECKQQLYATYMCNTGGRCLKASYICNPHSKYHCPGEAPEDQAHCSKDFDPLNP